MSANKRLQELAIVFIWNYNNKAANDFVKYAEGMLSRDIERPFSREIDLPLFFYPGKGKNVPVDISVNAERVIVYPILDCETVTEDCWQEYFNNVLDMENGIIVPVAFEENCFISGSRDKAIHHIRAYEFKEFKHEQLFIGIAHEIYRYGFNDRLSKLGSDSALKIFISHAKATGTGITVASKIKEFLDKSVISNFFDAYDIAPGYRFDEEIENNIMESTVVLINSDVYSSRHWCQKEILAAKRFERPMIEVDALEKGVDRKFPYASNIPTIRIDLTDGIDDREILRVLSAALLETIRFYYAKMKMQHLAVGKRTKTCYRPPELVDLEKIIQKEKEKDDVLQCTVDEIVYPDPPVYSEEIEFLKMIGLRVVTPTTQRAGSLLNKAIGISVSEVSDEEMLMLGQNVNHLKRFGQMAFRYLSGMQAALVYGGDLRPDGFTEQFLFEARLLRERLHLQEPCIKNYLSWPIYLKDNPDFKKWKAVNKDYIKIIEVEPEEEGVVDKRRFIPPVSPVNVYLWARALTKMRKEMISACDARIIAGGRLYGYKGKIPGVLEEIMIASEQEVPFYLLGGFGGVGRVVGECRFENKTPIELTDSWQQEHNKGLKELKVLYEDAGETIDYSDIIKKIRHIQFRNGLTKSENEVLFRSVYTDEIMELILKGMKKIFSN